MLVLTRLWAVMELPLSYDTVSRLYPCAPKALAAVSSRLRSCRDARYPQVTLREKIKQPACLDASDANVARERVAEGLARCNARALLQTKMVLARPWALLELFLAMRHGTLMKKIEQPAFETHPLPKSHTRGSQKALPDPMHWYY